MAHIISFSNQKGGVGKTTSAVNIAACLGSLGYRVLLLDADPQGNTTSGVGISKKNAKYSMYDVLLGDINPADAVVETKFKGLSVIPANIALAGAEVELIDREHRELSLKKATDALQDQFDFMIIDSPPSLGLLTVNALTAADSVVIPVQCEFYSLEGLSQLMLSIRKVKQLYNKNLTILGILITMYNGRLNLSSQVTDELKRYYSDKLFSHAIARNVKLSEAPSFGMPAIYHDKYSKGSMAYMDVAKEIIDRVGL